MLQQLLTDEDWKLRLASILDSEEGRGLESFLETEWKENIICPPKHMIFDITPFESVRVVIRTRPLPYHRCCYGAELFGQSWGDHSTQLEKHLPGDRDGCRHSSFKKWRSHKMERTGSVAAECGFDCAQRTGQFTCG